MSFFVQLQLLPVVAFLHGSSVGEGVQVLFMPRLHCEWSLVKENRV